MKPYRLALSLIALTSVLPAIAVDEAKIDALVKSALGKNPAAMAVAVSYRGKTIYNRAFGLANIELKVPAKPDTVFEIGSVTKQFTAALIMMLVQDGKVNLDDPVSKYLDKMPDAWKAITVRHCLTHTSGIPDYLGVPAYNPRKDYTDASILSLTEKLKLDFEPGSSWSYTNTGFYLLGMIVEKISGKSYATNLSEKIFKPLGMSSTRTMSATAIVPNRASGYNVDKTGAANSEILRESAAFSAGNLLSTTSDMLKWDQSWIKGTILKPEAYKASLTPVKLNTGRPYEYAFGWMTHRINGIDLYEHGGNTYGQSAGNLFVPSEDVAVIILSNTGGGSFTRLGMTIAGIVEPKLAQSLPVIASDPNLALTKLIRDNYNEIIKRNFTESNIGPEFRAQLMTMRGRGMAKGLGDSLGRCLALKFAKVEEYEGYQYRTYRGTFDKMNLWIKFKVTPIGQVLNLEVLGPG